MHTRRTALHQPADPQGLPERVVAIVDDGAFERAHDAVALARMRGRDVGDVLGQSDRQADVPAVNGMACRRPSRDVGSGGPARDLRGIVLQRLADIVDQRARDQHVAIERQLRDTSP